MLKISIIIYFLFANVFATTIKYWDFSTKEYHDTVPEVKYKLFFVNGVDIHQLTWRNTQAASTGFCNCHNTASSPGMELIFHGSTEEGIWLDYSVSANGHGYYEFERKSNCPDKEGILMMHDSSKSYGCNEPDIRFYEIDYTGFYQIRLLDKKEHWSWLDAVASFDGSGWNMNPYVRDSYSGTYFILVANTEGHSTGTCGWNTIHSSITPWLPDTIDPSYQCCYSCDGAALQDIQMVNQKVFNYI